MNPNYKHHAGLGRRGFSHQEAAVPTLAHRQERRGAAKNLS